MKLSIALVVLGILTLACNAHADPVARPMPAHVVKSPSVRPVTPSTVVRDTSHASQIGK